MVPLGGQPGAQFKNRCSKILISPFANHARGFIFLFLYYRKTTDEILTALSKIHTYVLGRTSLNYLNLRIFFNTHGPSVLINFLASVAYLRGGVLRDIFFFFYITVCIPTNYIMLIISVTYTYDFFFFSEGDALRL